MWSGPLHDTDFVSDVLAHVEASEDKYGTVARMKGMLTVAKEVRISFFSAFVSFAIDHPDRNWTSRSTSPRQKSPATSIAYARAWTTLRERVIGIRLGPRPADDPPCATARPSFMLDTKCRVRMHAQGP